MMLIVPVQYLKAYKTNIYLFKNNIMVSITCDNATGYKNYLLIMCN